MDKEILISVSPYIQKYYFNESYSELPVSIKEEAIEKLSLLAEKINCIISIGFYEDGELFIEEQSEEPLYYDDIGAGLEIKKFQTEEREMLKGLKLWYMIYCTENGQIVRDVVVFQTQRKSSEEILESIEKKYGTAGRQFAKGLMEE